MERGERGLAWSPMAWVSMLAIYSIIALALSHSHQRSAVSAALTLALAIALIALSLIDFATMRLPDVITLPLIAAGCIIVPAGNLELIGWHILAAVSGYAVFYLMAEGFRFVRGYPGMGLGDAKLLAASGAWVGLEGLPTVVFMACCIALTAVVTSNIRGMALTMKTRIPFGPYLALATWIVWFLGPLI